MAVKRLVHPGGIQDFGEDPKGFGNPSGLGLKFRMLPCIQDFRGVGAQRAVTITMDALGVDAFGVPLPCALQKTRGARTVRWSSSRLTGRLKEGELLSDHQHALIGVGCHFGVCHEGKELIEKVPQYLLRQRANLAMDDLTVGDK